MLYGPTFSSYVGQLSQVKHYTRVFLTDQRRHPGNDEHHNIDDSSFAALLEACHGVTHRDQLRPSCSVRRGHVGLSDTTARLSQLHRRCVDRVGLLIAK